MQAPGYELAASTTDSSNPPRLLIEVRARASEDDGESLTDDDTAAIQAWLGKWESTKVIIVRPEDADGLRELGPEDLKSRLITYHRCKCTSRPRRQVCVAGRG